VSGEPIPTPDLIDRARGGAEWNRQYGTGTAAPLLDALADRLAELEPVERVLRLVESQKHEWPVLEIEGAPGGGFIARYAEVGMSGNSFRGDGDAPLAAIRALAADVAPEAGVGE
jgi:hypothetical protein